MGELTKGKVLGILRQVLGVFVFAFIETLVLPISILLLTLPLMLFAPPLFIGAVFFAVFYCFKPILISGFLTKFTFPKCSLRRKSYAYGIPALIFCVFTTTRQMSPGELFGPSPVTYAMLFLPFLFSLWMWRLFSDVFLA